MIQKSLFDVTYVRMHTYRQLLSNCLLSTDKILSHSNKNNCIHLLKAMGPLNIKNKNDVQKAAVLVPLCEINNQLALLYTVRAPHLKVNGGQVSFPGGMQDKNDKNLEETALRETYEEIGLPLKDIDVWGSGPEIYRLKLIVTPYLGYVKNINLKNLNINSNEVSMVFFSTLKHLSNSQNFRTTQFRLGKTHVYSTPVYLTSHKRIWGLTAMITHTILSALIPEIYNQNIQFRPTFNRVFGSEKIICK